MIFIDERIRLTPAELNLVRGAAARNGLAHNRLRTRDELLQALLDGLPAHTQDALLAFMSESDSTSG